MTTNGQPSALLPCLFCALEAEMKRGGRFFTANCVRLLCPGTRWHSHSTASLQWRKH